MTKQDPKLPPTVQEETVQDIVKSMQDHFAQTGTYRIEDLDRVLGDQRDGIGFVIDNVYMQCARKHTTE